MSESPTTITLMTLLSFLSLIILKIVGLKRLKQIERTGKEAKAEVAVVATEQRQANIEKAQKLDEIHDMVNGGRLAALELIAKLANRVYTFSKSDEDREIAEQAERILTEFKRRG